MLDYISRQPAMPLVEFGDNITKTDWQESNDTTREYGIKFVDILQPYLTEVATQLFAEKFIINNMWYQQYAKNSKHQWHYHGKTAWSAVYFLELPHNNLATQILDIPHNRMVYEKEIEEGDLFIFPASLLHRSPENLTDDLKTIISFNLDFDIVNIVEGITG